MEEELSDEHRKLLIDEAVSLQANMKYWAVSSPHNFAHYDVLISAELARVNGYVTAAGA